VRTGEGLYIRTFVCLFVCEKSHAYHEEFVVAHLSGVN
jgi:hypothetical protein